MSHIVVLGDLNLDVHARQRLDLAPGEEARDLVRVTPGGSAGTFARTAAAHGASVTFLGSVGHDLVGDLLIRSLEDAGVKPIVQRVDRPSGVILALQHGGERTMICSRGANDEIHPNRIDRAAFDGADHLHISGYALISPAQRPAVERAIEAAAARNLSVSVDPPPANLIHAHGVPAFLGRFPRGTWLFPNRTEGELLTGALTPDAIVNRLAARSAVGALTLGADGSLAWAGDARHEGRVEPLDAVDTTGAGDAFAGAFVVTYLEGRNVEQADIAACSAARQHLCAARFGP